MVSRSKIIEIARSFIGTPFHHQARSKGIGIDCAGLIGMVASEAGIVLEDHPELNYSRYPSEAKNLEKICDSQLIIIPKAQIKPGSVILFWVHRPRLPQHLAFFVGSGAIIHAWHEAGRVAETTIGPFWNSRVFKTYDLPGVS